MNERNDSKGDVSDPPTTEANANAETSDDSDSFCDFQESQADNGILQVPESQPEHHRQASVPKPKIRGIESEVANELDSILDAIWPDSLELRSVSQFNEYLGAENEHPHATSADKNFTGFLESIPQLYRDFVADPKDRHLAERLDAATMTFSVTGRPIRIAEHGRVFDWNTSTMKHAFHSDLANWMRLTRLSLDPRYTGGVHDFEQHEGGPAPSAGALYAHDATIPISPNLEFYHTPHELQAMSVAAKSQDIKLSHRLIRSNGSRGTSFPKSVPQPQQQQTISSLPQPHTSNEVKYERRQEEPSELEKVFGGLHKSNPPWQEATLLQNSNEVSANDDPAVDGILVELEDDSEFSDFQRASVEENVDEDEFEFYSAPALDSKTPT